MWWSSIKTSKSLVYRCRYILVCVLVIGILTIICYQSGDFMKVKDVNLSNLLCHNHPYFSPLLILLCKQIHNPLWDLSVASQFGQSLEESLAVLMKPDNIPSELQSFKLHKYSTDMILSDFKKGNFLKTINRVNSAMDISH